MVCARSMLPPLRQTCIIELGAGTKLGWGHRSGSQTKGTARNTCPALHECLNHSFASWVRQSRARPLDERSSRGGLALIEERAVGRWSPVLPPLPQELLCGSIPLAGRCLHPLQGLLSILLHSVAGKKHHSQHKLPSLVALLGRLFG